LIASGQLDVAEVSQVAKIIDIEIDGEDDDIALIDAVLTDDAFVGARALLDADAIKTILLTRADPAAVGMTSLGGLLRPLSEREPAGLLLELGAGETTINAPLAPGLFSKISIRNFRDVAFDEPVRVSGPGVLALDGERERVMGVGQTVSMRVSQTGPRVVDINLAMKTAACRGLLRQ